MFKITSISRIILAVGALALLVLLKTPIWSIYLTAPQYPEGLEMKIWQDTLTGDVKVISALNHYIGMRAISVDMFPEFQYMGNLIIAVAVLCFVLALVGRWWSALGYWIVLAMVDSLALYDFWRWGYDYGHNLDPTAPIVIPGMAYQPPVIGYKQLLNFEAWSLPDIGGLVLMGVTGIALFITVFEWWKKRKQSQAVATGPKVPVAAVALVFPLLFVQCSTGPQPINYGTDSCDFCKMTLVDKRYGAEIVTTKGKVYKFDDVNCLVLFEREGTAKPEDVAGRYITDFARQGVLLDATKAVYLRSENLKTPMASQVAAFATQADLEKTKSQTGGESLDWEPVQELFN
ncbi:MAG: nitrous oxide reductase accessory protein NosL [Saprospiraceae bacterium]